MTHDRSAYEKDLLFQIGHYLRQTAYPLEALEGARVELWLSCHWLQTQRCSLIVFVKGNKGHFAMGYPLDSSGWGFEPERLLWLGRENYPPVSPQTLGLLKITARSGYDHHTLTHFLTETGIFTARNKKGQPLITKTLGLWPQITLVLDPFSEFEAAKILKEHIHSEMLIKDVTFLPAHDQDGPKAMFYTTRLDSKHLSPD